MLLTGSLSSHAYLHRCFHSLLRRRLACQLLREFDCCLPRELRTVVLLVGEGELTGDFGTLHFAFQHHEQRDSRSVHTPSILVRSVDVNRWGMRQP